jgi:ADP-ribose pyrophosphatase YjhB (NUDIX family)
LGHFCVKCGSPLEMRLIEGRELEACPNDDFVLWRDPKVVAAVVVELDGGIVLGRRAIEPGYGEWCLPGGFVDQDEDPATAALRECREEIGADVELTGLLGVYHIPKTTAPSIVGVAYRARVLDGAKLKAGPEMLEVRAFTSDELPQLAFPSHRAILDAFLKRREQAAPPLLGAAGSAPLAWPPSPPRAASRRPRRR